MKKISKLIIIVAVLIILVAIVLVIKNKSVSAETPQDGEICDTLITVTDDYAQNLIYETITENSQQQTEQKSEVNNAAKSNKNTPSAAKAEGDVLAIVEGEKITEKELENEFSNLSPKYQDMFRNDKELYLEQLIIKKLLVQKAIGKGYITNDDTSQSQQENGIQQLLAEIGNDISIPDAELENFYQENKDQMQGASFDQMKDDIRNYLIQQKKNEMTEQYIDTIRNEANIVLNEEWIAKQLALKPKNPLTDALQNGLPTVLDLGSDTCIPCQMMMPIFDELEKELAGKVNVILLQIADYRNLANKYEVRVIPTQIFFDRSGAQYWRHEGFLSKEDIIEKLKEMGARL
ncbi:MAG TPA: thioredoxin domain-containing protein [Candidatus Cloacimonadota bacterium]|nr:thioredoxin domain-containing protein [Candidatus Cloacimonadota bacterium]